MDWNTIAAPIIQEALTGIVLPVLGSLLLAAGTWVGLRLKEKLNIDITDRLNSLLHLALDRAAEALLLKYVGSAGNLDLSAVPTSVFDNLAKVLAGQVERTNPGTVTGLKASPAELKTIARQTLERKAAELATRTASALVLQKEG